MHDFLIIGGQGPMKARLEDNSNVFKGIPPYFTPYGRDFIKISQKAYSFSAYALPILAACLEKMGFPVSCINDFYSDTRENVIEKIRNAQYGVILSTTFLTSKSSIVNIARFVKKTKPNLKLIMGGPGIINFPGARRHADINVFYEGEETIQELACALSRRGDIANIKGISYFNGSKEIFTGRRSPIADLGRIPIPDWSKLSDKIAEEKYLPIESSRGCIGNCSFCLETKYWPGVRFYPIDRVINEIKEGIKKFGIRFYYFQDSNIANNKENLRKLCDAISREGLKIKWSCESRIDVLTKGLIDSMYRAGCRAITFGMESADTRILRNMNKPVSGRKMKEFLSIVKYMRKKGMLANINIIVGFPGEDEKSIENTINSLLEARPTAYSMSKFFLEKGTDIWKNRKRFRLKGTMYRWEHKTMASSALGHILNYIFLRISKKPGIYHWTSASVDLIRHMGKGKSFTDFVRYLESVNSICVEDLIRKDVRYSDGYNKNFRYITEYLSAG